MDAEALTQLLTRVESGGLSVSDALERIRRLGFTDTGSARVDHHRELRQGMAEVVFGEGKTAEQIVEISDALTAAAQNVLVTRVGKERAAEVTKQRPSLQYHPEARCLTKVTVPIAQRAAGYVAIVTAGTSDLHIAREAELTLEMAGVRSEVRCDVGVAGLHRLLAVLPWLNSAWAVICIAGMEGALPSVVGGLVSRPVVAVPTSVGYGSALSGFTALMGMLTGCSSGVTVVNIDSGFGAAMAVVRMAQRPFAEAARE